MSEYVVKGGRQLRFGYTTGSCATAAATAAAVMLFAQKPLEQTLITLPQGEQVVFSLEDGKFTPHKSSCAVIKDAGDDPDVTDGMMIVAVCERVDETFGKGAGDCPRVLSGEAAGEGTLKKACGQLCKQACGLPDEQPGELPGGQSSEALEYSPDIQAGNHSGKYSGEPVDKQSSEQSEAEIIIEGGEGIGVVTMDGLSVPKGEAAINPVPRKMITSNVAAVCREYGYTGGLRVTISAPEGAQRARKTFNPRLGIVGGISILGTTGIVEPMSEKAMVDTVKLLLDKQKLMDSETVVIAPGNYGRSFVGERLGIDAGRVVAYANFLGECLDYIVYKKFQRILLVGHFGKLVKVAGGIMQTHSSIADCRMEIITAHAACAGADKEFAEKLMACPTTDAAVALLEQKGIDQAVFASLLEKISYHLSERLKRGTPEMKAPYPSKERTSSGLLEDSGMAPVIEVVVFSGDDVVLQSKGAENLIRHCRKEKV